VASVSIGRSRPVGDETPASSSGEDLPHRWSAQRKTELVLRLLRGEPLDGVSRDNQVLAHELESWKRAFLEAGARGLKRPERSRGARADPGARQGWRVDHAAGARRVPHCKKGLRGRVEKVQAVRGTVSPGTRRRYPLTLICHVFREPRSSGYAAAQAPPAPTGPPGKRGSKTGEATLRS
jgi:hypothetical protein